MASPSKGTGSTMGRRMAYSTKCVGRELGSFVRQYGRTRGRGGKDPNDRGYDRKLEALVKRMPPDELDLLLRGDDVESDQPSSDP